MVMLLLPLSLLLDWTLKPVSRGGGAVHQKDSFSSRAWDLVGDLECFLFSTGQLCSHLTLKEVGRKISGSCFTWASGTDKMSRYQEGCLSARCLVILEGKAFFSCRAAVWREDVMAEVDDVVPLEGANTLGRIPSPWPLRRYA
jgi:hypothetical protein